MNIDELIYIHVLYFRGIVPITCDELFKTIKERKAADPSLVTTISFCTFQYTNSTLHSILLV